MKTNYRLQDFVSAALWLVSIALSAGTGVMICYFHLVRPISAERELSIVQAQLLSVGIYLPIIIWAMAAVVSYFFSDYFGRPLIGQPGYLGKLVYYLLFLPVMVVASCLLAWVFVNLIDRGILGG